MQYPRSCQAVVYWGISLKRADPYLCHQEEMMNTFKGMTSLHSLTQNPTTKNQSSYEVKGRNSEPKGNWGRARDQHSGSVQGSWPLPPRMGGKKPTWHAQIHSNGSSLYCKFQQRVQQHLMQKALNTSSMMPTKHKGL